MKDILKKLFNHFIDTCISFVGIRMNSEVQEILDQIFLFMADVLSIEEEDKIYALNLMHTLFGIQVYSDYILLSKGYYDIDPNIFVVGDEYSRQLEGMQQHVKTFNSENFKEIVNKQAFKGQMDAVRLKAYLSYLGLLGEKNEKVGINLFKRTAYSFDAFALEVLAYIPNDNKEYYEKIFRQYCKMLESLNLNSTDSPSEIVDECHLISLSQKKMADKKLIDHDLITRIIDLNVPVGKRMFLLKNFSSSIKKNRIGF